MAITSSFDSDGEAHLERRDAARITETPVLRLATNKGSRLMLIDLPKEV
ncbi:hypothetical protein [Geobacillus sp. TFV-3]